MQDLQYQTINRKNRKGKPSHTRKVTQLYTDNKGMLKSRLVEIQQETDDSSGKYQVRVGGIIRPANEVQ